MKQITTDQAWARLGAAIFPLIVSGGCASYNIEYKPIMQGQIKPVAEARVIEGHAGRIKELSERVQLPHHTLKDRLTLLYQIRHEVTSQLGSHDYQIIGAIGGGGNARVTMQDLKEKMAQRAAEEGGDIVFITETQMVRRPFVYTTPGYATTNYYAYSAHTTYHPGTSIAGVLNLPSASGAVLKHSPGWEEINRKYLSLDNEALVKLDAKLTRFNAQTEDYDARQRHLRELVNELVPVSPADAQAVTGKAASQPAALNPVSQAARSVVTVLADDGFGSGFCVSTPGTILTAAHVVEGSNSVSVQTLDGKTTSAVVLYLDPETDLAILMINQTLELLPLPLRETEVEVGEECFALGAPKGLSGSVSKGIVSAVRFVETVQYIQTDAAINPGNSGGPLIDRQGAVLGMCVLKRTGTEGIGFGVGIKTVQMALNR